MVRWREFQSREEASRALALKSAQVIERSLQAQTQARTTIVVSGGTTPARYFGFLQEHELDWSRVVALPSDERWVPTDHPESNERMIRSTLLQQRAARTEWLGLYDAAGVAPVKLRLSRIELPFAFVVLGMGEDGHTASLFPTAADIRQSLASTELCIMQTIPGQTVARISLTIHALLQAERIDLLFFGNKKKAVFEQALEAGPAEQFPIRAVLHQKKAPVEVWWAP